MGYLDIKDKKIIINYLLAVIFYIVMTYIMLHEFSTKNLSLAINPNKW